MNRGSNVISRYEPLAEIVTWFPKRPDDLNPPILDTPSDHRIHNVFRRDGWRWWCQFKGVYWEYYNFNELTLKQAEERGCILVTS